MSELIQYRNGLTIEVAAPPSRSVPVKGSAVERIEATFETVVSTLDPLVKSFSELFAAATSDLAEAQVKVGVGFTAEGSLFVSKATAEANVEITLTFKRDPSMKGA